MCINFILFNESCSYLCFSTQNFPKKLLHPSHPELEGSTLMASLGHREALNELARGQLDVLERLRSLLRLSPAGGGGAELSFTVSDGILQSFGAVFEANESIAAAIVSGPAGSVGGDQREAPSHGKSVVGHQKKRKLSHSWTTTSCAPYDDGFQWRKYGEKKISKSKFTRSYFRCAYKDEQGCLATKQVQQKEMEDPPMFFVTYSNEHTCSCLSSLFLTEQTPVACSMNFQAYEQPQEEGFDMFRMPYSTEIVLDDLFGVW